MKNRFTLVIILVFIVTVGVYRFLLNEDWKYSLLAGIFLTICFNIVFLYFIRWGKKRMKK
jgi:uncharacterized BrkB/YihY/UPF0761 family membrane protein